MTVNAETAWAHLWGEILGGKAARQLVDEGVPVGYLRELYPLQHRNDTWGRIVQFMLANTLAASIHGARLGGQFAAVFAEIRDEHGITPAALIDGNRSTAWHWTAHYLSLIEVEAILTGLDPSAVSDYDPVVPEVKMLVHALAWWLLCDDETLRRGEGGATAARWAMLYLDVIETCDMYRDSIPSTWLAERRDRGYF